MKAMAKVKNDKRLQTKKLKLAMQEEMQYMADKANSLRDQAAQKMPNIPRQYKVITMKDEKRILVWLIGAVLACLTILSVFIYCVQSGSDVLLIVAFMFLCIVWSLQAYIKKRSRIEEDPVRKYYVNAVWSKKLWEDLNYLREGIADYNRQYSEQVVFIQKISSHKDDVEALGGSLELVMQAWDFHAEVKLQNNTDTVDCQVGFTPDGYRQLTEIIAFFDSKKSA